MISLFSIPATAAIMCFSGAAQVVEMDPYLFDPAYYDDLNKALSEPDKVKYLNISMQKITALNPEIGKLKNLTRLDLSFNKFTVLPESIGALENLEYLNLSGCYNMIKAPEGLSNLKKLKLLEMKDMLGSQKALIEKIKTMVPPGCTVVTGSK